MINPKQNPGQLNYMPSDEDVAIRFVNLDGEQMYCIRDFNLIPPFLMTIVSSSDLWMYISSSGGLTAGRQNYDKVIFPYDTDDKLHLANDSTGPATVIKCFINGEQFSWKPFFVKHGGLFNIKRNIYKNATGNKVVLEEINFDLNLIFRYCWMSSDELGWVRRSQIINTAGETRQVEFIDGLLNLQPWGVNREMQSMMSTLVDAYKNGELLPFFDMALYYLSSIPLDRAEPNEALRANVAWTTGLDAKNILLSTKHLDQFHLGATVLESESKIIGQKLAFLVKSSLTLKPGEDKRWYIVTDVAKDHAAIVALQNKICNNANIADFIEESVLSGRERLKELVALSDGIQNTRDTLNDRRHFANVMFNIMRGGVFELEYKIETRSFIKHIKDCSPAIYSKFSELLEKMDEVIHLNELLVACEIDEDLFRVAREYLPLTFSRRHGDPSRPWNYFDIKMVDEDGRKSINYQGNWRDIFQNWEALGLSFPLFIHGMIFKFLNASTADGYNPYRVTRQGFEWEVPEADNPWAYIGYWGDHQIIYLLRLMELQEKFFPGSLMKYSNRSLHVYAKVPYRIKRYREIVENPRDTIIFNCELHEELVKSSLTYGNEAKLEYYSSGQIQRATFIEKILVTLLTKLSNYIPDAGIWLNTQRPEWNDANNALVGNGASVVTLCYIRRFIIFLENIIKSSEVTQFNIALEVHHFYMKLAAIYADYQVKLPSGISSSTRRAMADELGMAGEQYRELVYSGFSGQFTKISKDELLAFSKDVLLHVDSSIAMNQREDGLFHSYNLIKFKENGLEINYLPVMLEGQVAVLNSGMLNAYMVKDLLEELFKSDLWRADQKSFMLYPWKDLPGFMEKNMITPVQVVGLEGALQKIMASSNDIFIRDENGNYHFSPDLRNDRILKEKLEGLVLYGGGLLSKDDIAKVSGVYEEVFMHRFFTGRSGSFYKYEGLGSIYWHMVSKLLLAIGEGINTFGNEGIDSHAFIALNQLYQRVREGIGVHKKPSEYGAFTTDPYSHTPAMMGVQKPGLTGQVKEDILSRFIELGIVIENGQLSINTKWINDTLFDERGKYSFQLFNVWIEFQSVKPSKAIIEYSDKMQNDLVCHSLTLPVDVSNEMFNRTGVVKNIIFC